MKLRTTTTTTRLWSHQWRCVLLRVLALLGEDLNLFGVRRGRLLGDGRGHGGLRNHRRHDALVLVSLAKLGPVKR